MADVTKSAVGHYAEYEQLVGGVETLFKDSSGKLIDYAEKAYKTAGMSSNQYMNTATSFAASLIQGLGGDTAKAVELTNLAITDMSDNANKMGTDIGSIQDAYQGFAKQNYTMLDNLKLGYGGTQSEMIRLINDSGVLGEKIDSLDNVTFDQMIEAIHKIQDNLGITGTTALEAGTTISGSWSSVQALFENILTKVGSKLAPTVMGFLQQLSDWMETVDWDAFATSVGDALQRVFDWIQKIDFTTFFEKGMDGVENFLEKLGGLIEDMPKIIQTFKDWSPLIAGVAAGFVTLKVAMAIASLISAVSTAIGILTGVEETATVAQTGLNTAMLANPAVFIISIIAGLVVALITLWNTNDGFREAVTNIWNAIKTTVTNVINSIKSVISSVFNAIKSTISSILNSIKSTFTSVWNSIKSTVSNVINGVKSTISSGLNAAKSTVSGVLNSIKAVFSNVWNGCKSVVSNAINHIKSIMHFSWSLPHLKLPHISISGSFSLKPPSVPHFGIEWYKKAMDDGMILNQPTIFGYNAKSNRFLAGGEAGSETVVGTQNLMDMIQEAVNNSGNRDDGAIQALLEAIYNWMRNGGLYTLLIDALTNGVEVEFDNREIARLVKKYA